MPFKLLQALRQGRLTDGEARRGATEVAFPGENGKISEVPELHRPS